MKPLDLALVLFTLAGVWAAIEIALTIRKARGKVVELTASANESLSNFNVTLNEIDQTLAELNPVIVKVDGLLDELQPSVKNVDPLIVSTIDAVDNLSKDLVSLEGILEDVNHISSGAASASDVATNATNAVANAASDFVTRAIGRITGAKDTHDSPKIAERIVEADYIADEDEAEAQVEPAEKPSTSDAGYFKYPAGE